MRCMCRLAVLFAGLASSACTVTEPGPDPQSVNADIMFGTWSGENSSHRLRLTLDTVFAVPLDFTGLFTSADYRGSLMYQAPGPFCPLNGVGSCWVATNGPRANCSGRDCKRVSRYGGEGQGLDAVVISLWLTGVDEQYFFRGRRTSDTRLEGFLARGKVVPINPFGGFPTSPKALDSVAITLTRTP